MTIKNQLLNLSTMGEALSDATVSELEGIAGNLAKLIEQRKSGMNKIVNDIHALGFTVDDFVAFAKKEGMVEKRKQDKAPKKGPFIPKHDPVYRIEQDGVFIEWSGRGRPPKAFKEVKAAGNLEKYRI